MPLARRHIKNKPRSDQHSAGIILGNLLHLLCTWRGWLFTWASAHVSEYSGLHFAITGGETELHQANNHSGDAQLTTLHSVNA